MGRGSCFKGKGRSNKSGDRVESRCYSNKTRLYKLVQGQISKVCLRLARL